MNSDLIESPFCRTTPPIRLEADYRKISAEHSRSADRAGVLKIDCLPNDPAPGFFKLAPSGSGVRAQNCVARMEEKRCCTENTAPCSRFQQMGDAPRVSAGRPRHSRNHAMIHRPLWMSNFTKPCSLI